MEDIQSWWRVPTIAHFCSLFRAAFNLLDFDIEELEEALIQETSDDSPSSFLENLIVRLLGGCYQRQSFNLDNYHKTLRDFVKRKCPELDGVLNETTTFNCLLLKDKVKILHTLCDARLDASDVAEVLKNLEADSLRVEPLGNDAEGRVYWYFYGTRLYREETEVKKLENEKKNKKANKKKEKKRKRGRQKKEVVSNGDTEPPPTESILEWRIVCSTEDEWKQLAEGFRKSKNKCERDLHRTLTCDFLPEISRMIAEKEKMAKKKLIEMAPRRTSRRIEVLKQQKEDEEKRVQHAVKEAEVRKVRTRETHMKEERQLDRHMAKEDRARRARLRAERARRVEQGDELSMSSNIDRYTPDSFDQFEEAESKILSGMLKIFEVLRSHPDSGPFADPVDEEIAPDYYTVIKQPMDLSTIEKRLNSGHYVLVSQLGEDVMLMIENCRKYNGIDSDYTKMAEKLGRAFSRAVQRYFPKSTSEEEDDGLIDVDGDDSPDVKPRINMPGFRPRRQASLRAIEMLAHVAEDALRSSNKKRGTKRKTRSPSWNDSSESSSEDEFAHTGIVPPSRTYSTVKENSFIVKVDQFTSKVETKAANVKKSMDLVNKMVDRLPDTERTSVIQFRDIYKQSLGQDNKISSANLVVINNSSTTTAILPTTTLTTPTVTKITIPIQNNSTNSSPVVVPVKKRAAYYITTTKDSTLGTATPAQVQNTARAVISLLKKPVVTQQVVSAGTLDARSIAVTGHVSTSPVVVMSSTPTIGTIVNRTQVATTSSTTPTQIQYTLLPANVVPLTVRAANVQTQPQVYYLQQQGNQFILKPQIVSQVNGTQLNTQLLPAGPHKTLVALAPMTNSGSSSSNMPQY